MLGKRLMVQQHLNLVDNRSLAKPIRMSRRAGIHLRSPAKGAQLYSMGSPFFSLGIELRLFPGIMNQLQSFFSEERMRRIRNRPSSADFVFLP